MSKVWAHPILSAGQTKALEARLFAGVATAEWRAMQSAGLAVAEAVLADFNEIGGIPECPRILVLAGKGHNGGDALLAAQAILECYPHAHVDVRLVYGMRSMRPLALRSWQALQNQFPCRVREITGRALPSSYDLCLDGLFGFQYRPPLDARASRMLEQVNALPIKLRAAVDLPSGGDGKNAFRADFTYATGVLKGPVLSWPNTGRVRYLDLGFFGPGSAVESSDYVLTDRVLEPLRGWRKPQADKRSQGHLFVVAGSRNYPGAALMTVTAALRSGAGLVTAFVPESLVSVFAAQVPEAIWVGWPETPEGGLALEGRHLLQERISRATALVLGPGLGREAETVALAAAIVGSSPVPILVDADALQPEVISVAASSLVLTPHAGEYARIAGKRALREFAAALPATVVLKGSVTRICSDDAIYHSLFGGPVLARGGSGDLLAGIIGAQLARTPDDVAAAVCAGVVWHGSAADALARAQGAVAVRTTQLLDFLPAVLRM
jgi:ADP-dependent NAD(P)H-hydrate dehydratase / NAD(P)H-hydrate epimerase